MRVLVTGAGGFVGGHLIDHLTSCGDSVLAGIAIGDQSKPKVESVEFDITDYNKTLSIVNDYSPNVIYHLAGISFVPQAESDFPLALSVNVAGTHNLVRSAHLLSRNIRFIFVSSAEVYGKLLPSQIPVKEAQPVSPANNYSLSKAMAEMVVKRYASSGSISAVILRPFNHIGPGQNDQFVTASFASQLAKIKIGKAEPVIQVGNLSPQRDFSDVRDIVKAYRLAALHGQGIYNLGSGKPIAIQEILDTLIKISELNVKVEQDPSRMRSAEVQTLYADISKAKKELLWEPSISLKETLNDVYQSALFGIS